MNDYTSLKMEVEVEYDAYCVDRTRDLERLFEKLSLFLTYMTRKFMMQNRYVDEDEIGDIVNDTLADIIEKGLERFEKKEADFSTFCAAVVKNKIRHWMRKQIRIRVTEDSKLEQCYEEGYRSEEYRSPEQQLLACEERLEMITLLKKYIKVLMDWDQKPYRTVSCGFTMILFQKYHPKTKELTSPKWAYEELADATVEEGASRFIKEMKEWMPTYNLVWGDAFINAMDEMEDGLYVSDIIFGERFKVKDFENWSLRLRKAIKKHLLETGVTGYAASEL